MERSESCEQKTEFMKMIRLIVCVGLALFAGCSKPEEVTTSVGKPVVTTVNYPLAYFAERIAGDSVDVVFPEIEGDPAFWQPSIEAMVAYQNADLILLNGASYAKWIPRVSLSQAQLVDTSAGFKERQILLENELSHQHGPGGEHAHGAVAFTTWLDPLLAIEQAAVIRAVLSDRWPENRATFDAGFQELKQDLIELDAALTVAFAVKVDVQLIGSHPVYQYLSRRYDLKMSSVHWEPEAALDAAMLRDLAGQLRADSKHVMLWEDVPLEDSKAALLNVGVDSVVFNPCGNRPEAGDYLSVMQQNVLNVTAE